MEHTLIQTIREKLPVIDDYALASAIAEHGKLIHLEPNTLLMQYGDYIKQIPIVLEGLIKVSTQSSSGQTMLLYYLGSGNTCPTAFTCCMNAKKSEIQAEVLEPTEIIALPAHLLDEWIHHFPNWKNFVLQSYQVRFQELLHTIDNIAFSKIDQRLIDYLSQQQKLTHKNTIKTTHQAIADDLNTSREAISRLLKKMEKMEMVSLQRNQITILNIEAN
jgi:CRP/FNR family transcriptional regulator